MENRKHGVITFLAVHAEISLLSAAFGLPVLSCARSMPPIPTSRSARLAAFPPHLAIEKSMILFYSLLPRP